jgi:hypothetical protein
VRSTRSFGLQFPVALSIILFEPAPQGGFVDPQNASGTFEASQSRHDSRDVLPLELAQGDVTANPRTPVVIRGHDFCKSFRLDSVTRPNQERSLDDILELAQVCWPGTLEQHGCSLLGKGGSRPPEIGAQRSDESSRQRQNVFGPLPQWRDADLQDVQSEEEVFSKVARADILR